MNSESFTRLDPKNHRPFACSAHFLWLGERTRKLDAAQVEYLRGIHNPIGIKLSHQYDSHELFEIIQQLNPYNQMGKIVLMTRLWQTCPAAHYWHGHSKFAVGYQSSLGACPS